MGRYLLTLPATLRRTRNRHLHRRLRAVLSVTLATCCLILIAGGVPEAASSPADPDTSEASPRIGGGQQVQRESSPLVTLAAIEQAWNMGWVDSIVIFFPEGDITLRLDNNVPESASFTQKQASYMLRDSFRYRITESFQFLEFKYNASGKKPPSGKAQWSFRREQAGKTIVAKVQVTLRKDGERWLISGIRIQD